MTEATWAKLCYRYLYNITCSGVEVISVARESGGKDRYAAYFYNTTPFLAKDVKLRAYIAQDGKYIPAKSTTTEIGPTSVGDGRGGTVAPAGSPRYGPGVSPAPSPVSGNAVRWEFGVSVPPESYKVVVSANLQFTENGAMLPEPLTTRTAYGRWGANLSFLTGTKMEVAPSITARGPNPYSDNWAESGQMYGQGTDVRRQHPRARRGRHGRSGGPPTQKVVGSIYPNHWFDLFAS